MPHFIEPFAQQFLESRRRGRADAALLAMRRSASSTFAQQYQSFVYIDEASLISPEIYNHLQRPLSIPFGQALTKRMIHAQQAAFRYGYLIEAWCYCNAHPGKHFHRRVRRVGHLPMLTVKEVPE